MWKQHHLNSAPDVGNTFWTETLERWKHTINLERTKDVNFLQYTNINLNELNNNMCNFTEYNNVSINNLTDTNFTILPISQLTQRYPKIKWNRNNRELLKFTTQSIRNKLQEKGTHLGNYFPTIPYELQLSNPNKKGCRTFYDNLANNKFDRKAWKTIDKFTQTYDIQTDEVISQITALNKTTLLIPAHDLQFTMLRNICITNEKLFLWNLIDSPKCNLCGHNIQNSTHRFYTCKEIKRVWDLLSEILGSMGHYTYIDEQIAILNFLEQPKNSFLTLIVNYTRKLINNAHLNNKHPNPNTLLHNWSTTASIMFNNTRTDRADWILFSQLCTSLIHKNNPQTLPTTQRQTTYTLNTETQTIHNQPS